jgi:hypothetical protein
MTMTETNPEQLLELLDGLTDDLVALEEDLVSPSLEPEARSEPFAGLSASARKHPDAPPRITLAPRLRGSTANVLASFKWV